MKIILVLLFVALTASSAAAADEPPKKPSNQFKITAKKADDSVEVLVEKDKTVFSIKSPSGISEATIERTASRWPETMTLRLYLNALEHFEVSNGKTAISAAVSSHDGKVRVWKDGKENAQLDEKSPFWLEIRPIGGDGKPTEKISPKNGYFEVKLPKALFEGNPKSITSHWIDAYR
jgi:hypothetical protein